MKDVNVPELNRLIEAFIADRDWDQFHSLKNLSMALVRESSELMELFQWQTTDESNRPDEILRVKLEAEMADVFYYLIRLSHKSGIDLDQALRKKLLENAKKYPVGLAKGNSKKYSDL